MPLGRSAALRRTMATTDLVEALAARRAAAGITAGAVIYSTVTAALLQPARAPAAVRFDGLAAVNRPGPGGAWQRRRERTVLERADVLLPWSEQAAPDGHESLVLPPPIATAAPAAQAPRSWPTPATPTSVAWTCSARRGNEPGPRAGCWASAAWTATRDAAG